VEPIVRIWQLLSILSLKDMLKWFSKLDAWLEDNIFVISGLISLADATRCEYDIHWVFQLKTKTLYERISQ
jgi:hypothetical protein